MEKLRKLNAFAMSSPRVFSNLPEVSAAMDVGIGQVQTAFANFNGSFQVPSADQLGWARTIGVEWKKKEELDRAYQRVLDKLKKGEKLTEEEAKVVEAYKKKYPELDIDKSVTKASAKELSKETGMSYEDAYNFIVNGVLSDENKGKIKLVKNAAKYAKGGLYISSSGRYYWKHSGKNYWKNNPNKTWNIWKASKTDPNFDKASIKDKAFSKKGARYTDLLGIKQLKKSKKVQSLISKISKDGDELTKVGKVLKKADKGLSKISSKLKSYEHGRLNKDLKMMKENQITSKLGKVGKWAGKGLKAAGWLGTAIDAKDAVQGYKKKGYSNEQTAALATRKVAVDMAATTVGSNVGRVAGAAVGQAIIPIPGVGAAIGSVAGSIVGGMIGSKVGDAVNAQMDKGVKPKKSGWSWPW